MTIQSKVNLSLAAVFLLVLLTSITTVYQSETSLALTVAEHNTQTTADNYFDSINIMMLSGAMANRKALQDKILSNPELTEARIIRAEPVSKVFGPGLPDAVVVDELDRRAMAGEEISEEMNDEQGHRLTVVKPIIASSSYKGTNCLTCHQVEEGTILGAVRVTYSFESLDASIMSNVTRVALLELGMFIVALFVIGTLLHRIVVNPLRQMSKTIHDIEQNSDLTRQLDIRNNDEIGQTAASFNSMLQAFRGSIQHVVTSIDLLSNSSQRISDITVQARSSSQNQMQLASEVSDAMATMSDATQSVSSSADATVSASGQALTESNKGAQVSAQTQQIIEQLQGKILQAAEVIQKLEQESHEVDTTLSVIQGIAEQTNLLALNAAIEAARAGEQGRGFAVVADEVRSLSQRTQTATIEINTMIDSFKNNAQHAVNVMQEASNSTEQSVEQVQSTVASLTNITTEMEAIANTNNAISDAVHQHSDATVRVEESIATINRGTESAINRVEQLSEVSQQITNLAEELEQRAQQFKV